MINMKRRPDGPKLPAQHRPQSLTAEQRDWLDKCDARIAELWKAFDDAVGPPQTYVRLRALGDIMLLNAIRNDIVEGRLFRCGK